jgi:hypothetical protein
MNGTGTQAKLNTIGRYKFYLAFENNNAVDYVTEKFFHSLIVGTVPGCLICFTEHNIIITIKILFPNNKEQIEISLLHTHTLSLSHITMMFE